MRASAFALGRKGGVVDLKQFQAFLPQCKINEYDRLSPERPFFVGNSESSKTERDSNENVAM